MGALIRALLTLIGGWKAFFGSTIMLIGMVFLYNLVVEIVQEVLNFVVTQTNSNLMGVEGVSTFAQYTGFGAWVVTLLKLPQCLSFIFTVVALKWTVRKIPFIRW